MIILPGRRWRRPLLLPAMTVVIAALAAGCDRLSLEAASGKSDSNESSASGEKHSGEDPKAHAGHAHGAQSECDETNSLELSPEARRNVGLRVETIKLGPFERTISVPAMIVERPGRSQVEVTAPFTGVVTNISPIEGEAIRPGQPLFELQMTHEDLVTAQADFLRNAEELDVVRREVARLEGLGNVIPGKTLLTRQYELQKLEAGQRAQYQRLLLHTLTESQVEEILKTRNLLKGTTIAAPQQTESLLHEEKEAHFHVQRLFARLGQSVEAGDSLCRLADHCELYIEGKAFEDDAKMLGRAVSENWDVSAVWTFAGKRRRVVQGLKILYLADAIDADSRAMRFYVQLPNKIIRDATGAKGHRFITWQYRPGQRVELLVPVERWQDQIVLPIDAVIREGAEAFVFQRKGDRRFDRVGVHVLYSDQHQAVINNTGKLKPGDKVAVDGAYQIHLAMKNKSGSGVDAHAGHGH